MFALHRVYFSVSFLIVIFGNDLLLAMLFWITVIELGAKACLGLWATSILLKL